MKLFAKIVDIPAAEVRQGKEDSFAIDGRNRGPHWAGVRKNLLLGIEGTLSPRLLISMRNKYISCHVDLPLSPA